MMDSWNTFLLRLAKKPIRYVLASHCVIKPNRSLTDMKSFARMTKSDDFFLLNPNIVCKMTGHVERVVVPLRAIAKLMTKC